MFQTMPSSPSFARVMPAVSLFMDAPPWCSVSGGSKHKTSRVGTCSHVQETVLQGRVGAELVARARPGDAALLQDDVADGEAGPGEHGLFDGRGWPAPPP